MNIVVDLARFEKACYSRDVPERVVNETFP